MGGLFSTLIAEHDGSLAGELDAIVGKLPVERRTLLRLRERGVDLARIPRVAARELLALTCFKLDYEFRDTLRRIEAYEARGTGRRPNSFAHNLLLVAALEEQGSLAAAARWLGPPITPAQVAKAGPKAAKTARDFLLLVNVDGDPDAFLKPRILAARRRLIETDELLRRDRSRRANAGAHPAVRKFYDHDLTDQTLEPTPRSSTAAMRGRPGELEFSDAADRSRSKQ
jgi:hypothetical protein